MLVRSPTTTKPKSRRDVERFESGKMKCEIGRRHGCRRSRELEGFTSSSTFASGEALLATLPRGGTIADRFGDRADVFRRRAATAADDIEPAVPRPIAQLRRERFRRFRKTGRRKRIGQAGVWIGARKAGREPRHFLDVRPHLVGPERAVQTDDERLGVPDRGEKRSHRLSGQGAPGKIGDRAGNEDGHVFA